MDVTTLLQILGVLGAVIGAAVVGSHLGQQHQKPTPVRVPVRAKSSRRK
jgi:hypothetical protein